MNILNKRARGRRSNDQVTAMAALLRDANTHDDLLPTLLNRTGFVAAAAEVSASIRDAADNPDAEPIDWWIAIAEIEYYRDVEREYSTVIANLATAAAGHFLHDLIGAGRFAARANDHQFWLLLDGDAHTALATTDRTIRMEADEADELGWKRPQPLYLPISVGASEFNPHATLNVSLISAEAALREAKMTGPGTFRTGAPHNSWNGGRA